MNIKFQILLSMTAMVSSSFLEPHPNQFQSTLNSTFIRGKEKLFKPIVIPNITGTFENPRPKTYETYGTTANEIALKKVLQPHSEESSIKENVSENLKKENSQKFSSRYSTKPETQTESSEAEETRVETTEIPERNATEKHKSFSDRSDHLGNTEEEDTFRYDSREPERIEIVPTTNEPYSESQRPRNNPYYDDFENYETTSAGLEEDREPDSSEEKDDDDDDSKRSIHDYDNSGSKNYHSIQTPLSQVKYRGPHSYGSDFEPEKTRTRLVSPINRHNIKHNWPYTRPQIKAELEKLNEISDSNERYEKELDEEIKEEVKTKPDLELAVAKDELKFDRNKKYNVVEERNRRKNLLKGLTAEEEKDYARPLFHNLKQYQVDEEPQHQKFNAAEEWPTKLASTTPKNIFKVSTSAKEKHNKEFATSNEAVPEFQGHQFLGPVMFNPNGDQEKFKSVKKPPSKIIQKTPFRNAFLNSDLTGKENVDQANLNNKNIQKWTPAKSQSFNHLEESDEMYNAILANIQSVFGLRTQPLKSGSASTAEVTLDETKSFTWSSPLRKRENSLKGSE